MLRRGRFETCPYGFCISWMYAIKGRFETCPYGFCISWMYAIIGQV
jgi:nitrate reductase NapE component